MWKKIQDSVFSPRVDATQLEQRLRRLNEQLPAPVFWLLGKAQSGKTSIIKALTADSRVQIGDGMRPCTATASYYDFPGQDDCLLRFLDTRGLGEIDYDPSEDLAAFENQTHVLVVVIKAMDHAQQAVLDAVRKIIAHRPHWPLLVVQTCLHEGYPDPRAQHPPTYPYDAPGWQQQVPTALARSIEQQRRWFKDFDARFVAVDLTRPEDGYQPVDYGLESLWNALEALLPAATAALLKTLQEPRQELIEIYASKAHPHIVAYSLLAGAAAALPLPLLDIPLVMALQIKLLQTIGSIYGYSLDRRSIAEISAGIGITLFSNLGRRQLSKLIPVYGSAVSSLLTAASTYALGKTLGIYLTRLKNGGPLSAKVFRQIYAEQFEEGRRLLKDHLRARKAPP